MDGPKEIQLLAMASVQDFLNKVVAIDQQHAFLMLLSLASATGHVMAALQGCKEAADAMRKVAAHLDTNPRLPGVSHEYGDTEKVPTVEGNNTIN